MPFDINEIKNKAQEALGKHSDKIEEGIDKAGDFAKSKFGQHSEKIDNVTGKAKDLVDKGKGDGNETPKPDRPDDPPPANPS